MKTKIAIFLVLGCMVLGFGSLMAEVPRLINYQGKLTTPSGALVDAIISMQFSIYADSTTSFALWSETQDSVKVEKGIFNVFLGSLNPISDSVFDGTIRYLGIKVGTDPEMSPRKAMVSVGYALKSKITDTASFSVKAGLASNADTASYSINAGFSNNADTASFSIKAGFVDSADNADKLDGYHAGNSSGEVPVNNGNLNIDLVADQVDGIHASVTPEPNHLLPLNGAGGFPPEVIPAVSNADMVDSIHASRSPTPGYIYPLDGSAKFPNSVLYTGSGNGLDADKLDGFHAGNSAGQIPLSNGGLNASLNADMLDGAHLSTLNSAFVNVGEANSITTGMIVDRAVTGTKIALGCSLSGSYDGAMLTVKNSDSAGTSIYAVAESLNATGVYGYAPRWSSSIGVSGVSTYGVGVYGRTSGGSSLWGGGPCVGVSGETYYNTAYTQPFSFGVRGVSYCTAPGIFSAGVFGYGIYTGAEKIYGVWGWSNSNTAGSAGVMGQGTGAAGTYGVYYSGGLGGSGSKSCVVKISRGPVSLYCQESPESWFEDFGEGQLLNGRVHVELDSLFLETVTIDQQNLMKVFIQLNDENCQGTAVKRGLTGFDVVELNNGASNAHFTYRVVAKRKQFEDKRLERCEAGLSDPYLYPELRQEEP
jgi:hypothetical protein